MTIINGVRIENLRDSVLQYNIEYHNARDIARLKVLYCTRNNNIITTADEYEISDLYYVTLSTELKINAHLMNERMMRKLIETNTAKILEGVRRYRMVKKGKKSCES